MGTAPGNEQHPAMPDPARCVADALYLLSRLGFNDHMSLNLILSVAGQVQLLMLSRGGYDLHWIRLVIMDVIGRLAVLDPSTPITQGDEHADGSSSSTGGATPA